MASALLPGPHGGSLVNLLVDEDRSVLLKEIALCCPYFIGVKSLLHLFHRGVLMVLSFET
jgi:hypothetical protein